MQFEAREIQSYAIPVKEQELIEGNTYFILTFSDPNLCVPLMRTVVYVGKRAGRKGTKIEAGKEYLYFEDLSIRGHRARPATYRFTKDTLKSVFVFERALDLLMKCSLERKKRHLT